MAEAQLPLHLLLSGSNPKSIDDAKRLAENLMDTISVEFGASRLILTSRISSMFARYNRLSSCLHHLFVTKDLLISC